MTLRPALATASFGTRGSLISNVDHLVHGLHDHVAHLQSPTIHSTLSVRLSLDKSGREYSDNNCGDVNNDSPINEGSFSADHNTCSSTGVTVLHLYAPPKCLDNLPLVSDIFLSLPRSADLGLRLKFADMVVGQWLCLPVVSAGLRWSSSDPSKLRLIDTSEPASHGHHAPVYLLALQPGLVYLLLGLADATNHSNILGDGVHTNRASMHSSQRKDLHEFTLSSDSVDAPQLLHEISIAALPILPAHSVYPSEVHPRLLVLDSFGATVADTITPLSDSMETKTTYTSSMKSFRDSIALSSRQPWARSSEPGNLGYTAIRLALVLPEHSASPSPSDTR
ncbi:unnamed protein product [Protopolystoma xenopodis]|uniref:Uncharacterized protein n=1 Tax=Protopolystoma xenopodis TaxID=117903 RepID=A0A3S5ASZ8_9PLAT|nr:unnamed protein product [Protopolystoma xenopodis]